MHKASQLTTEPDGPAIRALTTAGSPAAIFRPGPGRGIRTAIHGPVSSAWKALRTSP